MGLDMYAFAVDADKVKIDDKGVVTPVGDECVDVEEIFYWRKFNALHGWMENLYRANGGEGDFNCVRIVLTLENLRQLDEDALNKSLVPHEGFFFGPQTIYPEDMESIFVFTGKARAAIASGKVVMYDSWW